MNQLYWVKPTHYAELNQPIMLGQINNLMCWVK